MLTLLSTNNQVDLVNGAKGVTVGTVNVKSTGADSTITNLSTNVNASGTVPTVIYLYDGSTLLNSASVPNSGNFVTTATNGYVSFTNLSDDVPAGTIKTLTYKVDEPSNTATGTAVSAGATTTVTSQSTTGNINVGTTTGIVVYPQYFYTEGPQFAFVSGTASSQGTSQVGTTTSIGATFVFTVTPFGNSMTALSTSSVHLFVGQGTSTTAVFISSLTVSPNTSTYAQGGSYTVTVSSAPITNSSGLGAAGTTGLASTGTYTFYLTEIDWTTSGGAHANQSYGLAGQGGTWNSNSVTFIH